MKLKLFFALTTPLLLAGCASHLSKEQCLNTNWNQLGYQDGLQGKQRNLEQDTLDCDQYKLRVDTKAYNDGNQAGLAKFCTYQQGYQFGSKGKGNPGTCGSNTSAFNRGYLKGSTRYCSLTANGFALGKQGNDYPQACSQQQFPAFYDAYQSGLTIHSQIENLQNQINDLNNQIQSLTMQYGFEQCGIYYCLTPILENSQPAKQALNKLNRSIKTRQHLQNRLYKLKEKEYSNVRGSGNVNVNINIGNR